MHACYGGGSGSGSSCGGGSVGSGDSGDGMVIRSCPVDQGEAGSNEKGHSPSGNP